MKRQPRTSCPICATLVAVHPSGRLRLHYTRSRIADGSGRCPAVGFKLQSAVRVAQVLGADVDAYEQHLDAIQDEEVALTAVQAVPATMGYPLRWPI